MALLTCLPLLAATGVAVSLVATPRPAHLRYSATGSLGRAGSRGTVSPGAGQPGSSLAHHGAPVAGSRNSLQKHGHNSLAQSGDSQEAMAGVTGGALFGGDTDLIAEQGKLGRKLAIIRVYDWIGNGFPSRQVDPWLSSGSTLLASIDTHRYSPSYAAIADGKEDRAISAYLEAANKAAIQYHLGAIYIDFEHEVNNPGRHSGLGSPAEYIKAWDHIHALAASEHLNWNDGGRLHWVWIVAYYYSSTAHLYWPGTGEVDIVGVDGYNTNGCRRGPPGKYGTRYLSPAQIFTPMLSFAQQHGNMPMFVAEWASEAYANRSLQPQFIHQMQGFVSQNREIAAALYWDSRGNASCNYNIDGNAQSMSALRAMAQSSGLQGHIV